MTIRSVEPVKNDSVELTRVAAILGGRRRSAVLMVRHKPRCGCMSCVGRNPCAEIDLEPHIEPVEGYDLAERYGSLVEFSRLGR